MRTLMDVFKKHNPTLLVSGQIRLECPFRENHSGKYALTSGLGEMSFFATPEKNVYHCFSCKEAGKLTSLLTTRFEVPYYEAVEMVNLIPYIKERAEWELDFWWEILPPNIFLDRGFKSETLIHFKVGIDKEKHIVIPLFYDKELKGVKFRVEKPTRSFWYSESFLKQEYLYNYNLKRSKENGYTILVEGETDTWRLWEWGLDVTGLLGVSLSDYQIKMLCKIPKIYLALDCDNAGVVAMDKIYHRIKHLTDVEFINYPASDPDKCKRREFLYAFKHPCNYAEFSLITEIISTKSKDRK